jgi:uncharacterized protein YkwD
MKIFRLFGLVLTTIAFLSLHSGSFAGTPKVGADIHAYKMNKPAGMEEDVLKYVNMHRQKLGLNPLKANDVESSVASRHSYNMATGKLPFGHKDLQKRMNLISKQIGYISATGENVASGQMNAREVVDGWLKSPGHRRNIEGDFTLTGIGVAKDKKGVIYFTQIFTK